MAAREEVLQALEKGRNKLLDKNGDPIFKGWNKQIAYCFSDTDESWLLRVVDGRPEPLVQQEVEEPDVRFTMTTDMMVGLMNGSINGIKAFLSGQVKVKASMADIAMLQILA